MRTISQVSKWARNDRKPHGFTLIELLLVLAIVGVVTAVVLPSAVRSMRGNRLRTAALQVAMAGRYARSMAVLRQEETNLRFVPGSLAEKKPARVIVEGHATNSLEDVEIAAIEINDDQPTMDVPRVVTYEPNGRCTPYRVTIRDGNGEEIILEVDEIASARTTKAWHNTLWRHDAK